MKKPLLAVGAAAALTAASVISPSVVPAPTAIAAEGSSTGTGIAVALGVLALIGGGAFLAMQQGMLSIPGLPGIPGAQPATGSCDPSAFDAAVAEWPKAHGTVVNFCDGRFASVEAFKAADHRQFQFVGGRWEQMRYDGTHNFAGSPVGCYNGYRLNDLGAPQGFRDHVFICTPDEIGR